jgi:N-acetylglucosaminyl-diphospho-decaprenol L-rhamnosyltransferase
VTAVDAVVVAYNSAEHLRGCVEPLSRMEGVRAIVADNASSDDCLATIADLPVLALPLGRNGGFSHGCNAGWRAGDAPYVLFLNPDARIDERSLRALAGVLDANERVGLVGPRIVHDDGSLALSQRRFPRPASTYARALFLHRLLPRAAWASETVQDPGAYSHPAAPDWVSGACMLVRRALLERLGGLDEGFFLYCEDKDLCKRIRDAGFDVRFEPSATAVHHEGASAPRPTLFAVLTTSRLRYARKHGGPVAAALERVGVALVALTHVLVARGGRAARAGHAASLLAATGRPPARPG